MKEVYRKTRKQKKTGKPAVVLLHIPANLPVRYLLRTV